MKRIELGGFTVRNALHERDGIRRKRIHLEYEGFFGGELCDLEAVVPLLFPAEDAAAQKEGLPQGGVPEALLLQQDEGSLAAACLPGELRPFLPKYTDFFVYCRQNTLKGQGHEI